MTMTPEDLEAMIFDESRDHFGDVEEAETAHMNIKELRKHMNYDHAALGSLGIARKSQQIFTDSIQSCIQCVNELQRSLDGEDNKDSCIYRSHEYLTKIKNNMLYMLREHKNNHNDLNAIEQLLDHKRGKSNE